MRRQGAGGSTLLERVAATAGGSLRFLTVCAAQL